MTPPESIKKNFIKSSNRKTELWKFIITNTSKESANPLYLFFSVSQSVGPNHQLSRSVRYSILTSFCAGNQRSAPRHSSNERTNGLRSKWPTVSRPHRLRMTTCTWRRAFLLSVVRLLVYLYVPILYTRGSVDCRVRLATYSPDRFLSPFRSGSATRRHYTRVKTGGGASHFIQRTRVTFLSVQSRFPNQRQWKIRRSGSSRQSSELKLFYNSWSLWAAGTRLPPL